MWMCKYHSDGSVFDICRLPARTKTVDMLIIETQFTDECAVMVHKVAHLQINVDRFTEAARLFVVIISLGKTEVLV